MQSARRGVPSAAEREPIPETGSPLSMRHGRSLLSALVAALAAAGITTAAEAGQDHTGLLLPDLVQKQPSKVQVQQVGDRFRLGFASAVSNTGAGPLRIEASRPSTEQVNMIATQVIAREDGRVERRENAGHVRYTRARGHEHWHLQGFDEYRLRRAEDGAVVAPDRKTGFCLGDRYDHKLFKTLPGEPLRPPYRQFCGLRRPDLLKVTEGISVGYGDNYEPYLEGQFIDITGVPAGRYDLVHHVNADGRLLESRYDNNAACVGVILKWPNGRNELPVMDVTGCNQPDPKEVRS